MFSKFRQEDKSISKIMMRYVSNFVKSGDPSKPQQMSTQTTIEDRFHGIPWPEYNQATRESYLEISKNCEAYLDQFCCLADKPRVKNYYRNAYTAFWNAYIPKLNRGAKDRQVDEVRRHGSKSNMSFQEHHFLPNHFNRQTFYGVVRPYSSFHSEPFPVGVLI